MHTLLHTEYARVRAAAPRRRSAADGHAAAWPKAPPGRVRRAVAHALGAAAGRVDRDVARRAVA